MYWRAELSGADIKSGREPRFLMGQHLVDQVSLSLGARPNDAELARQRGQAQARLALMQGDVLSALTRSDLNIGMIAQRYGLGERQAQRLFEQGGTTFTEFLLEHRLRTARKLLLDPANHWRKISDIAHSAGFSDLSYFNRAFRRRFGATMRNRGYPLRRLVKDWGCQPDMFRTFWRPRAWDFPNWFWTCGCRGRWKCLPTPISEKCASAKSYMPADSTTSHISIVVSNSGMGAALARPASSHANPDRKQEAVNLLDWGIRKL